MIKYIFLGETILNKRLVCFLAVYMVFMEQKHSIPMMHCNPSMEIVQHPPMATRGADAPSMSPMDGSEQQER